MTVRSAGNTKSQERLKRFVKSEITNMFTAILDYAEVAVDGKERYANLRSKILKVSNDTIREIEKELALRYSIEYLPPAEDIIIVQHRK